MTQKRADEIVRKVIYARLNVMPEMENSKDAFHVGRMIGQMQRQLEIELSLEIESQKSEGEALSPGTPQPKPEWISVSEGLPKVADCYAVTEKIGNDLITKACFFERPNIWHNDIRINRERNCLTNIVAWMPLPQPYKAESEK